MQPCLRHPHRQALLLQLAAAAAAGRTDLLTLPLGARCQPGRLAVLPLPALYCPPITACPAGRSQPSLNLSHATAVVLSQLFDMKQQGLMLAQQRQQQERQQEQAQQPGQQVQAQPQQAQQQHAQQQQQQQQDMSGSLF